MLTRRGTRAPSITILVSLLALAGIQCTAQSPNTAPAPDIGTPNDDPPGRVGRLSIIDGTVSFRVAGDTAWGPAVPNRPVTTGDALWADNDARSEVEVGSAELRLGQQTELDVLRLDDASIQVSVPQGSAILRLRTLAEGEADEIDAPNAAIGLSTPGTYRVDVSPDGLTTVITVLSGAANVMAGGASFPVNARQVATVRGDTAATYELAQAGAADAFEQWSSSRDAEIDAAIAQTSRYVSPYMPGVSDLEANGDWQVDATEGPVWYPRRVAAGWAPYREGHWVWVGRWGWTWVDDASWGWAPFHYGRWAYVHGRWGWCPGRTIAPPVYAPALVVFVGGRPPAAGRIGNVVWFPLAPREVYRPPYAASTVYVRRVNITTVTNVTNITNVTNVTNITYRNRSQPGAVTAVSQQTFVNGVPVRRGLVQLPPNEISSAPVLRAAPVVPTRTSLAGEGHPVARAALPPTQLMRRPVVALHAPPPLPVPFSAQEHALAQAPGRPLSVEQVNSLREQLPPAAVRAEPARPATATVSGGAPLRPVHPGVPNGQPAAAETSRGAAVGHPAVTRVTPEPSVPPKAVARPSPSPAARPASQPAERLAPGAPPMTSKAPTRARASLDSAYVSARHTMETRHAAEFAKPPAGETPQSMAERQDKEDRDLQGRYQQAAAAGKSTLPPAPRPAARTVKPKAAPAKAAPSKAAPNARHPAPVQDKKKTP